MPPHSGRTSGEGSADTEPAWFIDISGERSGPHLWSLVLELAQVGALSAETLLWRAGLPLASRADAFPELAELLALQQSSLNCLANQTPDEAAIASREPSATMTESAKTKQLSPALHDISSGVRTNDPASAAHTFAALVFGLIWVSAAVLYVVMTLKDWPTLIDGTQIARLQAFGAVGLFGAAFFVLPALWRALRGRSGGWAGLARVVAGGCAFAIVALLLHLAVNSRSTFRIAVGADPFAQPELRTTEDGQLEVRGVLASGVAKRIYDWTSIHPIRVLHLNSVGGWLREGELIADLIKQQGLRTDTRTGCYSACVTAFLAGVARTIHPDARLGFHSSSGEGTDPVYIRFFNNRLAVRLRALGAKEPFVERVLATPADNPWFPGTDLLLGNHLVDNVALDGFSNSGEKLTELADAAESQERPYPFLSRLASVDRAHFEAVDRSLRLAIRRGASPKERYGLVLDSANAIERDRLRYVSDQTVYKVTEDLARASAKFSDKVPAQCLAILGWNHDALSVRSPEALKEMGDVLLTLLSSDLASQPVAAATSKAALTEVVRHAYDIDPETLRILTLRVGDNPGESCRALSWLFRIALSMDTATGAGFLRELRAN